MLLLGVLSLKVRELSTKQFVVDLELKSCSGRRWELCGISCAHVVAAMGLTAKEPKDYVDPCYNKEAFLRSHESVINPINGPNN